MTPCKQNFHVNKPIPLVKDQTINIIESIHGYQRLEVVFNNKVYNKSDLLIKTGFSYSDNTDPKQQLSGRLVVGVFDITEILSLKVYFPTSLNLHSIRKLEYIHFTDEEHYRCILEKYPEYDTSSCRYFIKYSIPKPIYGGKYVIEWGL